MNLCGESLWPVTFLSTIFTKVMAPHTGHSSQLFLVSARVRNLPILQFRILTAGNHLKLLMSTTSRLTLPRVIASCLPSRDQANLKTLSVSKLVN